MGWLHTDHSHLISWRWLELKMYGKRMLLRMLAKMHSRVFTEVSELDYKSEIIENVLDCNSIIEKVVEPLDLSNCIKIISVGRLVRQKGFDKIPLIAKALTELKINFEDNYRRWPFDEKFDVRNKVFRIDKVFLLLDLIIILIDT